MEYSSMQSADPVSRMMKKYKVKTRYTLAERDIGCMADAVIVKSLKVNACTNWEVGTGFVLNLC